MFLKKTVSNIQAVADEHATGIRDELERATAVIALALVLVGAMAAFAVCYTVAVNND